MSMWTYHEPTARFFTTEQRLQVEALFEGIFPGGPDNPGARDADAAEYLDRLLAMDPSTYYEIPGWKTLYSAALPALDTASRAQYAIPLAELDAGRMGSFLANLARGGLAGLPAAVDQKKLFATLRAHCIEACFADPRWGGNKDKVIWRWFGYLEPARDFHRTTAPGGGDRS